MFTCFADAPQEAKVRELYAAALDHTGNSTEARRQRGTARTLDQPDSSQNARRLANLKASMLASEIDQPVHFPASDRVQMIAFWADWCTLCKPELDRLARYSNPRAKILTLNADHLDPALREYGQPALPQLYIVDFAGHIRFHVTSFDDGHVFARELDWMIEDTLHEAER
jgi:thiol-disulfide isomerase/thioredoxin